MLYVIVPILVILALLVLAWFALPSFTSKWLIALGRVLAGVRTRELTTPFGDWHYLDTKGDKPIVILVHGFGADKDCWLAYVRELSSKFRVIAPDLPGFGDSTREPDIGYRPEAQAKRLKQFVDAMGIERFHIAGNSMGGYVAMWFALLYPNSLLSMTLMNAAGATGAEGTELALVEQAIENGENPLVIHSLAEVDTLFGLIAHKPMYLPSPLKKYFYAMHEQHHHFLDAVLRELHDATLADDITERVGLIQTPTLVMWGRHDQILHVSGGELLAKKIQNSVLDINENAGHTPMVEAPKRTGKIHREFMLSTQVPPA